MFPGLLSCRQTGVKEGAGRFLNLTSTRSLYGAQPLRVAEGWRSWLQFGSQLAVFALVRRTSRWYGAARQTAYGTTANRPERDHDRLAAWGAGVRVPSAPSRSLRPFCL